MYHYHQSILSLHLKVIAVVRKTIAQNIITKMKNLDTGVLLLHYLTLKLWTKQRSKQTCLQIIVLLNITTITKHKNNGKQVNKNTTTNATRINMNNDVYIRRDFEKAKSWTFAFKHIHQTVYSAI